MARVSPAFGESSGKGLKDSPAIKVGKGGSRHDICLLSCRPCLKDDQVWLLSDSGGKSLVRLCLPRAKMKEASFARDSVPGVLCVSTWSVAGEFLYLKRSRK